MRAFAVGAVVLFLTGCECGPGASCTTDQQCEPWGRCGTNGYCVEKPPGVDSGTPKAVIPDTQVDFGRVDCGAMRQLKMITLTNSGTAKLTFTAEVTNPAVYAVAPLLGELQPDETMILNVTALAVQTSMAGVDLNGVLTIRTNDAAKAQVDLPLKMKTQGVTLTLTPPMPSFPPALISDPPQEFPLTLTNIGNQGTVLTLAQPMDQQFALRWFGSDAGPTVFVDAGASVPGLVATFKASKIGPASTVATIGSMEAGCGVSVSVIPLNGRGLGGEVQLSDAELVFGTGGRVDCATTAAPKTLTLKNVGNSPFGWVATLGKGGSSPFTVMPSSGALFGTGDAGVTLTITPLPIPATASTTQDAFGDVLTISTDIAGDPGHPIPLRQTANGAVFAFGAPQVDFGLVPLGDTARAPVSVSNTGNAPAAVRFTSSNPKFGVNPFTDVTIDGGTAFAFEATFSPDASVAESAALALVADGGAVLCGPLPTALTASGTGSTGSVSYTPVGLDFGLVNCGTAAAPQTVTFKNNGNQAYTISPALSDAGSPFAWSMTPDSGLVAVDGGTVVITVTPKPIPATAPVTLDAFGDTLTVTTDVVGDVAHLIALRQTARGAIFGVSTQAIAFGSVAVGGTGTSQFTVDNTGNAPGVISFVPAQPMVFALPRDAGVPANASITANATFTPQNVSVVSDSAAISVSPETVLCQPLPFASIALSGSGTASNGLAVSPASLTFGTAGLTPCGTTAAAKTISITNTASVPLALTLSLGINDGGSPYTVSGPATLGPGDAGTITVTPKAIPAVSATAPDLYADTVSIQAVGGPVNESHVVALHQTAQGAILSLNPLTLSFSAGLGQSQQKNFTVSNAGNLAAAYTLAIGGTNPGAFSVNPTSSSVSPSMGVTETVTFTGELLSPKRTANITLSTPVTRCGPLPPPISLVGNP